MKNYFSLTTAQQVGIVTWTILILAAIVVLNVNFQKTHDDPFPVSAEDMKYVQLNAQSGTKTEVSYTSNFDWQDRAPELFDFDPNTISKTQWYDLGFSPKQADAILSYREKNGPFHYKQDLKKIFVIDEEKFAELEPYILLDDAPVVVYEEKVIELNAATNADLEALYGIGEVFADRIIKYRNSLGGFISVTQLHEVSGMSEETYQVLAENVTVDPLGIKQLNVNTASKDALDRHPYIDWPMTAEILKKRDQGKITDLGFLVEKGLLTTEKLDLLQPYIRY